LKQAAHAVFQRLTLLLLRLIFLPSTRRRVVFFEPVPDGPFVLAMNHVSHFDPPLITISFPRWIDWIAMKDLFHGPVWIAVFRALEVIPVDRSGFDRNALRTAAARLKAGRIVGIFPEGGIRDRERSILVGGEMKSGAAFLAALAGCPILPGVIVGSDRLYSRRRWVPWRNAPIWIAFGCPLHPDPALRGEERRDALQQAFTAEILSLRGKVRDRFALVPDDFPQPPRERMSER